MCQNPLCRVKLSCPKAQLGRGERALRSPTRVGRQSDGALQERSSGCDASARLRAAGRSLQLQRDLFIGPGGGPGEVPGAPIRVLLRVGCFGQSAMHPTTILGRSRPVGGGADEWVREFDAATDLEKLGVRG